MMYVYLFIAVISAISLWFVTREKNSSDMPLNNSELLLLSIGVSFLWPLVVVLVIVSSIAMKIEQGD